VATNHGFRRADRVETALQRAVSAILQRELTVELPCLVTVTAVKVSTDLRHADVLLACFGDEEAASKAFEMLKEQRRQIRAVLPRYAPMKYVPELHLRRDKLVAQGTRVVGELGRLVAEADARSEIDGD